MKFDTALKRGIAVAVVHLLLVCTLGAKFLYDRQMRPRVWAQTASYDPYLPLRGRYVSLLAVVEAPKLEKKNEYDYYHNGNLVVREGKLWMEPDENGQSRFMTLPRFDNEVTVLSEPVLFFIPETVQDPSRLQTGQELWVELTIPRKGPPRPIQLAVKDKDGKWTPLGLD